MFYLRYFLVFIIIQQSVFINADYYSSIMGMEKLLEAERYMIQTIEIDLKLAERKNAFLKKFIDNVQDEMKKAEEDIVDYYENPINAFKAIKRLTRDWHDAYNYEPMLSDEEEEAAEKIKPLQYEEPSSDDLIGAAKGMARLQKVYQLDTRDLANGELMGNNYSLEMTPSDCMMLGMGLLEAQNYKYATSWLLEARARLTKELKLENETKSWDADILKEETLLEQLARAAQHNGNTKFSLLVTNELLQMNPKSAQALEISANLTQLLRQEQSTIVAKTVKDNQLPSVEELYEKTCRGELKPTPREQRDLRCKYQHNNVPFCYIAPFKVEQLSLDPYVAFYHQAIYDGEIANIFNVTHGQIQRSKVGDVTTSIVSDVRTSKQTWLWYEQNDFLNPLKQRLDDITHLNMETAEPLQVANYGIGGHYGPHFDFSTDSNNDYFGKGNRLLTALFYINDVELGGGTAFPFLHLAAPPIRGNLVLWYNMHQSLELDYRTKHAGCPVVKGSKWICNEWYHINKQELHFPCSKELHGHKSIQYSHRV